MLNLVGFSTFWTAFWNRNAFESWKPVQTNLVWTGFQRFGPLLFLKALQNVEKRFKLSIYMAQRAYIYGWFLKLSPIYFARYIGHSGRHATAVRGIYMPLTAVRGIYMGDSGRHIYASNGVPPKPPDLLQNFRLQKTHEHPPQSGRSGALFRRWRGGAVLATPDPGVSPLYLGCDRWTAAAPIYI